MPPPISRDKMIFDEAGRSRQITPREYFQSTGRIDARPRNPRYMSGLNTFTALQNRNVPAFSDPRRPGMSAREIGEDAASMGYTLRPDSVRSATQPAPTRESNIAAAKKAGTFAAIREKFIRENPGKSMDEQGIITELKAKETAAPTMKPGTFVDDTPGAASAKAREKFFGGMPKRDGTLAGAAGVDLEKLRPSFDALPTPPAATTPAASAGVTAAQRRQMLRDAATGRMDKFTDGRLSEIQSSYGKGSVKMLKPGEARPVAMTTDEFGKPETMKSYLARRKYIQSTKGMT